jgi:hypothetical protein
MTTRLYSIQLSEEEKLLFDSWLKSREEGLLVQLQQVKSLRSKLNQNTLEPQVNQPAPLPSKPTPIIEKVHPKPFVDRQMSWTNKIINVFKALDKSLISKEIIDWFVINDETVKHKSREFVSKSVTAKLAVLEEKGLLKKEKIDNKYYYSLLQERGEKDQASSLF